MRITSAALSCVLGLLSPLLLAKNAEDPAFTLRFTGPTVLRGPAGSSVRATYFCTLTHNGAGSNAQGWSLNVQSDLSLEAVSFDGTDALNDCREGTKSAELDSPLGATAYSRVQLSSDGAVTLANLSSTILRLDVVATVPAGGAYLSLQYANVYVALTEELRTTQVYQDNAGVQPDVSNFEVQLIDTSCALAPVSFGFSERPVASPQPFAGIIGEAAGKGRLIVPVPEGDSGVTQVFANIISNLPDGRGVSAWRLAILAEGLGVVQSATGNGTVAERAIAGGFHHVEVIDFATGIPRYGVVAVAMLPEIAPATLSASGTESVLALEIVSFGFGAACNLRFVDGLYWRNPEWVNQVTVSGGPAPESPPICNLESIDLELIFTAALPTAFVRGDANDDGAVDIADPVWTLLALFAGGPATTCADAADANGDGGLNVSDPVYLLGYLFLGGTEPPAPFPECGNEPAIHGDGLQCLQGQGACR